MHNPATLSCMSAAVSIKSLQGIALSLKARFSPCVLLDVLNCHSLHAV